MENGACYSIQSATQLYVYPNLTCTEGSPIPSTQSTTRDSYILNDQTKKWEKYQTTTTSVNTGTNTTRTIAHIYSKPNWNQLLNPNAIILPATIIVLCFFKIVLNMFMGVRR